MRLYLHSLFLFLFFCLSASPALSAPKYFFKVATIAPAGSVWITEFEKFTKEVSEKTGGEVGFRIYPGGVMGDDQAMLRKIRVGQLQGGGFTMSGIAQLVPEYPVMSIPFLFKSYEETDVVKAALKDDFVEVFKKKGLEFLAYNEVGFVYAMSTSPLHTLDDLKQSKSWTPSGDPLTEAFMMNLGITPIQLTIPDVLSSLQTGLVNTVFNSLYGSIVLQWYTKANYITTMPYGYAYGVFVLDRKAFSKLPDNYKTIIKECSDKYFAIIEKETRQSNKDSRKVLEEQGVSFVEPDPSVFPVMEETREKTVKQSIGKSFSKEIYEKTIKILDDYRNKQ